MPRSTKLPARLIPFLVLVAGVAVSARADLPQPAKGELKATAVEGEVHVTAKGAGPAVLVAQAIVHEGDLIETGPDGRVELLIATGTQLRIGPGARAELREAPAAGGRFRLRLAVGSLWAHVAKLLGGERFEVETENGVAGVRGTEFTVDAAKSGGDDLLRVYEGAVQCDHIAGKWSKRLEPGKELLFHRDRPTTLRAFNVAEVAPLHDWRPVQKAEPKGPDAPGKDGVKDGADEKKEERKEDKKAEKKDKKSRKERLQGALKKD